MVFPPSNFNREFSSTDGCANRCPETSLRIIVGGRLLLGKSFEEFTCICRRMPMDRFT
jgi:hypothetical protein